MIHPSAVVESQDIGEGTMIFAFTHVLNGASIGSNVKLCDHVFVEGGSKIGDNVTIKNNVSVWEGVQIAADVFVCLLYTSPSPRDRQKSRMPSSA